MVTVTGKILLRMWYRVMCDNISFRRWYLKHAWETFKETYQLWLLFLGLFFAFVLSGLFLPDMLGANNFWEKGLFILIILLLAFFIIGLIWIFLVDPLYDYYKRLREKYDFEMRVKDE